MSVLVDTGAWYAIADASDRHHREASGQAGLAFWGTLREARIPILTVEPVDLEAAWHIAEAFPDQAFSVVDCTTFALMERLGITDAFAFDAHFLVYRFGPGRQRAFRRLPR